MHLMQLQVRNFRNLREVKLEPVNGVNLITGRNASGKTSLLESIYYLSHVRSFRTLHVTDLIHRNSDQLQVFARIFTDQKNEIPIGIRRSKNKLEVRINRQAVHRVADIATQFPVQAIHPDSYKLITGSPIQRRQYLDWGVFHVEHGFFEAWQKYKRALSQRNAALKSKHDDIYCALWDKELAQTANYIDRLRKNYLLGLQPYLEEMASLFFPDQEVEVLYKRGWSNEQELAGLLLYDLKKDRFKGFTQQGPHRAELLIRVNGQSAQTGISRGQQKVLVALLRLAQTRQFIKTTGRMCVLLYDDLAAELDSQHQEKILSVLVNMGAQLFLTAIKPGQIDISGWSEKKMFHVEQGKHEDLI